MKRFLSLGAGVQSSTLALMIAHGELPPVDAAVFSDTQWEPKHVYTWLDWLENEINRLPYKFPIYRVRGGGFAHGYAKRIKFYWRSVCCDSLAHAKRGWHKSNGHAAMYCGIQNKTIANQNARIVQFRQR